MVDPNEKTRVQPVEVTCPGCFHPREWDAAGVCTICHDRANAEGRSVARVRLHFVRRIQQHPFCRDTDHVVATFEQCFVQCFFGRIRIQVQAGFR